MKATTVIPKREFALNAPAARAVCLVGDFTHWEEHPIPMKKSRRGLWKASVPLQSGTYHYRFLVDGQWTDDPNCPLHVPNPFGSEDGVRIVA
jgi:1,4-alpha-glucan branching enzyme